MLNINPKIKLVVGLILVATVGALNAVLPIEPTWKWIASVAGVLGFLESFFTVPPAAAAKLKAAAIKTLPLALLALVVLSCQAAQVAAPTTVAAVACVVDDAIAGKSISQIVLDCGGDTAQVIAILADPTNYTKVKGTAAYAEAGRAKTAVGAMQ